MKSLFIPILFFLTGCMGNYKPNIDPVSEIDLQKFMGDWYVLAHIPAFVEKNAFNAIESYEYDSVKKVINTTFTFNYGSIDGEIKEYNPKGFVIPDTNNAVWGMQFIWPIKAQYIIAHIDNNYENTVVARDKRDYLWFMSRSKKMDIQKKQWIYKKTVDLGYDKELLRFIPHSP
jgi:apolipoprotein D and lipocalin family protein